MRVRNNVLKTTIDLLLDAAASSMTWTGPFFFFFFFS
jgi:hypothetical protein